MRAALLATAAFFAVCGAACAQPGWQPAELKDFIGSADYKYRSEKVPFVSAEGDFDGDGQPDAARLMKNEREGRFALEVKLANGKSQHLAEGDLKDMDAMAVTLISPGLYGTTCVKGASAGACTNANIDLKHDAISFFRFNGENRYFYWTGQHFEQAYIVNPEG